MRRSGCGTRPSPAAAALAPAPAPPATASPSAATAAAAASAASALMPKTSCVSTTPATAMPYCCRSTRASWAGGREGGGGGRAGAGGRGTAWVGGPVRAGGRPRQREPAAPAGPPLPPPATPHNPSLRPRVPRPRTSRASCRTLRRPPSSSRARSLPPGVSAAATPGARGSTRYTRAGSPPASGAGGAASCSSASWRGSATPPPPPPPPPPSCWGAAAACSVSTPTARQARKWRSRSLYDTSPGTWSAAALRHCAVVPQLPPVPPAASAPEAAAAGAGQQLAATSSIALTRAPFFAQGASSLSLSSPSMLTLSWCSWGLMRK
jgi:hypothetical protein